MKQLIILFVVILFVSTGYAQEFGGVKLFRII